MGRLCAAILLAGGSLSAIAVGCSSSSTPSQSTDVAVDAPTPKTDTPPPPPTKHGLHFSDASDRLKGVNIGGTRGVGLVDFDNDGWIDVSLTGPSIQLYRNTGDGHFNEGRVDLVNPEQFHNYGLSWADIDADGDLDLMVVGYEQGAHYALWRNDGGTTFTDITTESGIVGDIGGRGTAFSDLDHDGDLDLYVCRGAVFGPGSPQAPPPEDLPAGGLDEGKNGHPNQVWRNDGTGHFDDVTEDWNLAGRETGESFMAIPFDFDYDGNRDLLLVHDWGSDQLFRNPGNGGPWEDVSETYLGVGYTTIMGAAIADFNNDGRWDIYGTENAEDADILYVQDENHKFVNQYDALIGQGLDRSRETKGWGVSFADLDNDGDLDIITAASFHDYSIDTGAIGEGVLLGQVVILQHETSSTTHKPFLLDVTGKSGEVLQKRVDGWGLAVGDLDRNGTLDVVVGIEGYEIPKSMVNEQPTPLILLNDSPAALENHAISIRLQQPGTKNIFAVGAVVSVTAPDTTVPISGASSCPDDKISVTCDEGLQAVDEDNDGCFDKCITPTACPAQCNEYVEDAECQCDVGCFITGDCCFGVCGICEDTFEDKTLCTNQPNTPGSDPTSPPSTRPNALRTTTQLVLAGASYVSQHSYALHFGLGTETSATTVKVTWPDGTEQSWEDLPAGEHTLTRGAAPNETP
jgi:hypothetical protein